MRALKLQAQVQKDHTLHLDLPEDISAGPAEVIVLLQDSPASRPGHLDEFLATSRKDSRPARTKEEIDAYLRAERGSWD